jgi:hypothetical protein
MPAWVRGAVNAPLLTVDWSTSLEVRMGSRDWPNQRMTCGRLSSDSRLAADKHELRTMMNCHAAAGTAQLQQSYEGTARTHGSRALDCLVCRGVDPDCATRAGWDEVTQVSGGQAAVVRDTHVVGLGLAGRDAAGVHKAGHPDVSLGALDGGQSNWLGGGHRRCKTEQATAVRYVGAARSVCRPAVSGKSLAHSA